MTDRDRVHQHRAPAERRRLQRMPLHQIVHVESDDASGKSAVLMDISADGALLLSDVYYRRGAPIDVLLMLSSAAATAELRFRGKVLRSVESPDGCTAALRFDEHVLQFSIPEQIDSELAA